MKLSKIRENIHILVIALFTLPAIPMAALALPAFPGAEGWGSDTIGGRSGSAKLYKVIYANGHANEDTNTGTCNGNICSGSLRYALEASGPRIVIFTVGGTITLYSPLDIKNGYLTVAGQTAPGGGILIKNGNSTHECGNGKPAIIVTTNDVILRGLRIRAEWKNAIGVYADRWSYGRTAENVIIDHNSLSWANDGVLDTWWDFHHLTVSYNIISEGIVKNSDPTNCPSNGGQLASGTCTDPYNGVSMASYVSYHHNIVAQNKARNPQVSYAGRYREVINNLVYGWRERGTDIRASSSTIGNHYKAGTSSDTSRSIQVTDQCSLPANSVYIAHNIGPGRPTDTGDDWLLVHGSQTYRASSPPYTLSNVEIDDVADVYGELTAPNGAGAIVPYRDDVDVRVVNDVLNGTGTNGYFLTSPNDVGGWPKIAQGTYPTDTDGDGMPDAWEQARGLNPDDSSDWNKDRDGDGYRNIEEYINSFFPANISANVSPIPTPSILIPNPPSIIGIE